MNYDGGYYLIKQPLIRGGLHQHTAAKADAVSREMLAAINIIQASPWAVNRWTRDLMREAWTHGDDLGDVLPSPYDAPLPAEVPEEIWQKMPKEARTEKKYERSKLHEANAKAVSKRLSFLRKLNITEKLDRHDDIYFPHFMDFRGRMYPMPQDLQPQGDDIAKGLLMFHKAKPLGPRGMYWLEIRLANTFGKDKLSFNERIEWVHAHRKLIADSYRNPLDGQRFWTEADEPWAFLATAREWYEARMTRRAEDNFLSHLPIPMDGTCNGLQHLSMMSRDPIGAKATNCMALDHREDVYTEVLETVLAAVAEDALRGIPEAMAWSGHITRDTVKRAVMTTPYGVTDRGIQDQLIKDKHTEPLKGGTIANAKYMRDKIIMGLSRTLEKARDVMAYFQGVAQALAYEEQPLIWRTPMNMEVTQSYYNFSLKRIKTLQGTLQLYKEDEELGLSKKKQVLASAPNIVHSFDASMLAETTLRSARDHGIASFAFVHDSYGTHACNTDALAQTLRDVAADMYSVDRLEEFENHVRSYAPNVSLPERPKLGSYDPEEVRNAPYFFA